MNTNPEISETLEIIGCDGTVVKTGKKGVIRLLEKEFQRPL